jgi:hypothetical protein
VLALRVREALEHEEPAAAKCILDNAHDRLIGLRRDNLQWLSLRRRWLLNDLPDVEPKQFD